MFKLRDLSITLFAIVKESESQKRDFPINAHGFIEVTNIDSGEEHARLIANKMSDELARSNELESLMEEAIEMTKEFVADEFGD